MIIIFVTRSFLRPPTVIILAANFLSNVGGDHVDETEEEATQMSEVSDAAPCSCHGRIKLKEAIDDHKVFGGNREEKVDIDKPIWEEPSVGQQDSINGSGGSDHGNKLRRRENCGANSRPDTTEEKIEQEFSRSPIAFQFSTKHP
jgi:hypothetical protein